MLGLAISFWQFGPKGIETLPPVTGPGGIGSPMGLLLVITNAS